MEGSSRRLQPHRGRSVTTGNALESFSYNVAAIHLPFHLALLSQRNLSLFLLGLSDDCHFPALVRESA